MTTVILDESIIQKRQQWVLRHPCLHVDQCGRPGYVADIRDGKITLRTVLTIDFWMRPWSWRSTIGVIGLDGKPKARMLWTTAEKVAAVAYARQMLTNIGHGENQRELDDVSFGFARLLTWHEMQIALTCTGNAPAAQMVAAGEINEYDFSDRKTQAGDGLHVPTQRRIIYGRGQ